ncbi:MAG: hypothetical protein EXR77_08155 [Myxococcales bacterium]|nr:hypothetical protein [Myxococcales bacterium]
MPPKSSAVSLSNKSRTPTGPALALGVLLAATLAGLAAQPALAVDKSAKEEAAAISQVATAKHQAGDFALCAELFAQAYAKDPTYLPYLFSAARCLHKKGDLDGAERDYRQFLARSPKGAQLVDKAQEYLDHLLVARQAQTLEAQKAALAKKAADDQLAAQAKAAKPQDPLGIATAPTPTVSVVVPPASSAAPMSAGQKLGWGAAATGAAALGVGLWQLTAAAAAHTELAVALAPTASKLVIELDRAQAQQRADAITAKRTWGAVATVAGTALLTAGVWLAFATSVRVAVAPDAVVVTVVW